MGFFSVEPGAVRRGPRRARWGTLIAAGVLLGASLVHAEPLSNVAPAARARFDEGRALMTKKDYAGACVKFEESQRIDPGGGTLLNLALCNERMGRTATAYVYFTEALQLAHRDDRADRAEFATQHIEALRSRLSYLRVVVPEVARVPGFKVMLNGAPIDEATWSERMAVDPGDQIVEAMAPNKRGARLTMTVNGDGEESEIVVDALPDVVPGPGRDLTQRVVGGIMGGLGLAGIGVGAFFGLKTLQLKKSADAECPDLNRCQPSGVEDSRSATKTATAATWLFASGALLTGAGVYLFASAPARQRPQAAVYVTSDGLAIDVSGRF
jgi:tetratricopeptide (TPR) repeat protein